jgi:hypothetical protein
MNEPWKNQRGKRELVQPMRMRYPDGTTKTVCCGPAALRELRAGATGYRPTGAEREGRCCHR